MIPASATSAIPGITPAPQKTAEAKPDGFEFSFSNLLDIVNPLQHIPVVGTLYRAITGDKIATPEKIAGGALFGGIWGLVSSVADSIFEAVTGKDFGSTVMALFTGGHKDTAVASNPVSPAVFGQSPPSAESSALMSALSAKGVDPDTARRATFAYSKTMSMAQAEALR